MGAYIAPPTISEPTAPPPQQFSTADGTLQGNVDGVNQLFLCGVWLKQATVFWNGIRQTLTVDVAFGGQAIKFLLATPQPGDVVTLLGYPAP